jgi:hypothetical protein
MNQPRVSIIILNWNGLDHALECLESLKKIVYPNYDVIVVDNASKGDDAKILRQKFGDYVHVIENDKNYGFAEGNNIGMRYALRTFSPAYLLLLNNDTVVAPDFLDELVKVAESSTEIGIVGPKIYYYDFEGHKDIIWFAGGKIDWWRWWIYSHIGTNDSDMPQYHHIANVDWISGAALMIKRSVIEKISFLDSSYFSGNEDVDYCLKARKYGFRNVYVPTARVWHKVGMARMKLGAPDRKHDPNFVSLFPYYRFIRRNFSLPVYMYHLMLLPLILFRWGISYLVKRRDKKTLVTFIRSLWPGQKQHI